MRFWRATINSMKGLLRHFLRSLVALYITSQLLPAVAILDGIRGLVISAVAFMVADILLIPLLRVLFLPLNLLTLGLFAWLTNVLALYFLVNVVPTFRVVPFDFPGANFGLLIIPALSLSVFQVVIVASFLIAGIIHILNWLQK